MEYLESFPVFSMFEKRPFIYFLLRSGNVVYVGKSIKSFSRIYAHSIGGNAKDFDSFSFMPVSIEEIDIRESEMILKYMPEYNIAFPLTLHISMQELKKRYAQCHGSGVDRRRIKKLLTGVPTVQWNGIVYYCRKSSEKALAI